MKGQLGRTTASLGRRLTSRLCYPPPQNSKVRTMLTAHYNMPTADFIAQLRTYVIAMGLSPQVVDAVDNLCGADEIEGRRALELQEAEDETEKETKDSILIAVKEWAANNLAEDAMNELLAVVESA